MSTRSVTVHHLSVEDEKRVRALVKASAKSPELALLDVLRAGLDALDCPKCAKAPKKKAKKKARKVEKLPAVEVEDLEDGLAFGD